MKRLSLRWLMAGGLLAFGLAGCSDPLDVENPNSLVEDDLESPTIAAGLANGALATTATAIGEMLSVYNTVSDEIVWIGSRDAWGQLDPPARLTDDLHSVEDRRALRYQRADRARWLLRHYERPGAPAEDRKLRGLLGAFVKGLNDERKARPKDLASYFVRHLQDLPEELRLTAAQFEALFARPVADWEPLALLQMVMRSLWEDVLDRHGVAGTPPGVSRLLPGGPHSVVGPSRRSAGRGTPIVKRAGMPSERHMPMKREW